MKKLVEWGGVERKRKGNSLGNNPDSEMRCGHVCEATS